jgi:fluoride ion exporter CrcB/FEX
MSVVVVTAIIAGIVRPNILMALVALFSFHMLASGYRALYLKRLHEGQRMQRWDFILQGSAAVINGALFLWGLINLTMGRRDSASIIFFVFGSVGLFMVWRNVHQFFKRSVDKREWLYMHMTGFLGGYIATVSAFSAVNLHMIQPTWLQWLWPTIIGSPLIAYWISYYRKGFAKGKRVSDMVRTRIQ